MTSTAPVTSPISIIIPTLNEAAHIAATVQRAQGNAVREIIVVDCGSEDATQHLARQHGAHVILAPPGRARQMNAGAAVAQGAILLFLHGDTLLPPGFDDLIPAILGQGGVSAGAFSLAIDLPGAAARMVARLANLRARSLQMPYGDQGLFVRRQTFWEVGGYPEEPILEDVMLVQRLRAEGRIRIVQPAVLTSGRRWRALGMIRTTLINQAIIVGYLVGIPPQRLQCWYRIGKKI